MSELEASEGALKALNKCLKIEPTNVDVWALKIEIMDLEEDTELNETCQKFLELLERELKVTPDDAMLWYRKGQTLRNLDQNDKGVESFTQAVQLNPKFMDAWTTLVKHDEADSYLESKKIGHFFLLDN